MDRTLTKGNTTPWTTKFGVLIILLVILGGNLGCANLFQRSSSDPQRIVKDTSLKAESPGENSQMRKRVMVLPFLGGENLDRASSQMTDNARITMMEEMNKSGTVIAFTESDLRPAVIAARSPGGYRLEELAKPAQDLGVTALMEGRLLDLKVQQKTPQVGLIRNVERTYEAIVEIRILNTRNKKLLFHTRKTVQFSDTDTRIGSRVSEDQKASLNPEFLTLMVQEAFLEFLPQVLQSFEQINWEGRIAAIQGDRLFLNVGKVSGLQVGDILKVLEDSSDIYDPESGGHLGRVSGRLKGTLEVISYFGQDGAVAIIHSGAGFKENDRIELYQ
mgnify:CR=1 FL=1